MSRFPQEPVVRERNSEGSASGRAEERERRCFVAHRVFRKNESPGAVVKGNGHPGRLDARGEAEGTEGAGAVFPLMI